MYIYNMSKITFLFSLCCLLFIGEKEQLQAQELKILKKETLIQPPYLKAGDTVAIVAPSGILKNREKEVQQAIDLLKSWNLHVVVGDHAFSKDNHFAGTDTERCEDFQKAMDDPTISAIWCARGGYGTVRILDKLDFSKFNTNEQF